MPACHAQRTVHHRERGGVKASGQGVDPPRGEHHGRGARQGPHTESKADHVEDPRGRRNLAQAPLGEQAIRPVVAMSVLRPAPAPLGPAAAWPLAFAGALIRDPAGRYLLQIRDHSPGVLSPGAYGLFGGAIEDGESADEAVRRELEEEIGWIPDDLAFWRTLWVPARYPGAPMRSARVEAFEGTITPDRAARLRQTEGAGRALMPPRTLLLEPNVATVARLAIGLHAQDAMSGGGCEPAAERWEL